MEPKHNNDYLPAVELPQVQDAAGQSAGPEQRAPAPEIRGTQTPSAGPVMSAPSNPRSSSAADPSFAGTSLASDNTAGAGQPQPDPTAAMTAGLIADDADLIEKEWVLKAKAIVMQTKSDPRQQNIEMNHVKADYLKKRYNKDLKTSGS